MLVIYNRLPHASACSNILWLCESYDLISTEGKKLFTNDLMVAFANHEGFSEVAYARKYNQNHLSMNLFEEISPARSRQQGLETSTPSTASTVRSSESGTNYTNPIQIDDYTSTPVSKIK
jgi:hypothetical protein